MSTTGKVVGAVLGAAAVVGSALSGGNVSTSLSSVSEAAAAAASQTKADEEGEKPATANTPAGSK